MQPFEAPTYATTQSVINAWCRQGNFSCSLLANELIGAPKQHKHLFGWNAEALSEKLFRGQVSADSLLDKHSQLPLFNSILPESVGAELREAQRWGGAYAFHRLNQYAESDVLESPYLRRCPQCVREDVERFGVAHWRLHHQWPFARHCAEHLVPLQQACKGCRRSPATYPTLQKLASDDCLYCGRGKGFADLIDDSPVGGLDSAYWSLLDLAFRGLKGVAQELRPDAMDARIKVLEAEGTSREQLHRLTLQRWRCQSQVELFERLGVAAPGDPTQYRGMEQYLPLMAKLAAFSTVTAW